MTYGFGLGRIIFAAVAAAIIAYLVLLHVYQTPTEQVQAAWTALGVLGAMVTGANAVDSNRDRVALREANRNGDLQVLANQAIRQDTLRLLQMCAVVAVGLESLSAQPTLTAAQRAQLHIPVWTPTFVVITSGIIIIVAIAVLQALLDRRARLVLYRRHGMM